MEYGIKEEISANNIKQGVINGTGISLDEILKLVKDNRPVIIWTSINMISPHIYKSWISDKTGNEIFWKSYNHALVVIGYTETEIVVSDPIDGKIKSFDRNIFEANYNYMGKKAIYY